MNKVLTALLACLMVLSMGGCKSKESIAWEKELNRKNQESKMAWEKFEERINNLPSCEGGQWFDYCSPNFFLPDYYTIQVHVCVDGKEGQSYAQPIVKRVLEARGYNVISGNNITEEQYFGIREDLPYDYGKPPVLVDGVKGCKIDNPMYREGSNSPKYYTVEYNKPLIDKLLLDNPDRKAVDAVLLVKCLFIQDGMSQYWRVDSQLFDTKKQKLTLWNRAFYRSGIGEGIKAMMKTKTGAPSSQVIGNKVYTSTPYWFEGNKTALLLQAMTEMAEHLPKRIGDKLAPRTLPEKFHGSCPTYLKTFIVFD